jgi:hypothetical protein
MSHSLIDLTFLRSATHHYDQVNTGTLEETFPDPAFTYSSHKKLCTVNVHSQVDENC